MGGEDRTDSNGEVIEEMLSERNMVCVNDGRKTRVDVRTGRESALDLTILSSRLAQRCEWEVITSGTIGSDHYPIICRLDVEMVVHDGGPRGGWIFRKADWKIFGTESDMYLGGLQDDADIEEFEKRVREGNLMAAELAIPKSSGSLKKRAVPWWDEKCSEAVKNRNRAFRVLKRTHNY